MNTQEIGEGLLREYRRTLFGGWRTEQGPFGITVAKIWKGLKRLNKAQKTEHKIRKCVGLIKRTKEQLQHMYSFTSQA